MILKDHLPNLKRSESLKAIRELGRAGKEIQRGNQDKTLVKISLE